MEHTSYEIEAEVERHHWWFQGRRKILARLLAGLSPALPPNARALDVGCGTGANGPVLADGGRFTVGVEASHIPLGLDGTGERGHSVRLRADAMTLPFVARSFDLVVALDVLEHLDDDLAAARELYRVTRPGGATVVFVPALRALWGLQDEVSHHRRRYDSERLRYILDDAGFAIERLTYFNTLLLGPIFAARLAMRLHRPAQLLSENHIGGRVANAILARIFAVEAPLLARFDLPIGVSLACVARRR